MWNWRNEIERRQKWGRAWKNNDNSTKIREKSSLSNIRLTFYIENQQISIHGVGLNQY